MYKSATGVLAFWAAGEYHAGEAPPAHTSSNFKDLLSGAGRKAEAESFADFSAW